MPCNGTVRAVVGCFCVWKGLCEKTKGLNLFVETVNIHCRK